MLVGYKHRNSKGFMDFSNANPYKMIHPDFITFLRHHIACIENQ